MIMVSMNNLSWPTCVLLGILLGLALVAADRSVDERNGAETSGGQGAQDASNDGAPDSSGSGPDAPDETITDGSPTTTDPNGTYALTLTFDDGPHPTYTPQILDLLEQYEATAVFCVVGEQVRAHPEIVRRIVDDGHALCNHTDSHDEELAQRDDDMIEHEIEVTDAAIDAAVGTDVEVRYFRQPNTFVKPAVAGVVADHGLTPLDWTVDPRDWSRPGSASIVQGVLNKVQPGAIVLLHDGGGDRSQTVTALGQILDALSRAGYGYVLPGADT